MREMKDSGIDWIRKIPENWTTVRLKYLLKEKMKYGATESGISYSNQLPRYIRITDISLDGKLKTENMLSLPEKIAKNYLLADKTILFARSGATVGKTFLYHKEDGKAAFAGYLISACCDKSKCIPEFLYYYTKSTAYDCWVKLVFSQATIQNIGADKYQALIIPLTKISEQQRIADFLDSKCSEIDAITTDIQKEITVLEEYKKSVITEAVTKGLNPNVEMKDSGIEWIGKIPKHWKTIKIKYMSTLNGRIGWQGLTSSEYQDEGPYLITGVNFYNGKINWESCVHITTKRWKEAKDIQIHNNDLLITKDGTVGKVAIVTNLNQKASLNSGVLKINTYDEYSNRFLFWVLQSEEFWKWFNYKNAGNSTIIHLYQGDFAEFIYTLPNHKKQQQIADYLDSKCSDIDATIADKQKQLEVLANYKKSLIYEYVTGKKEVPCHE